MSRRHKNNFGESAMRNNGTYGFYLEKLTELAISMFEWKNLPESDGEKLGVDSRFLELTLFADGKAVFFDTETLEVWDFEPEFPDFEKENLWIKCIRRIWCVMVISLWN